MSEDNNWGAKSPDKNNAGTGERARSSSAQCPLEEKNWIALEYLYCDGKGVADAHYSVINSETGNVVAEGTLDTKGRARCILPVSVNNVSYNFHEDPPTIEYLIQPVPNPELAKVRKGWFDGMLDGIAEVGTWIWGTVQGDFNENQTVGQIATNAVITMIPIVDQVGDVRDIVANVKLLIWDKRYGDKWVWIALVLTLIGLIPVLGSAAKGVLKAVANGLKKGGTVPLKWLMEILNKFHKGNAVKWLRKLAAELPEHAVQVKKMFHDILMNLRDKMGRLADRLPGSLGKQAKETVESIDEVAKIADNKIDEAVKELQDGLNKSLDDGVDFERKGATKSNNTRQQTDAGAPDFDPQSRKVPPGHTEPTGPLGGKPTGKRTKISDMDDEATSRSLKAENKSADKLADAGYKVEQNPKVPGSGNPDYRIEGKIFDCKAPTSPRPRNAASEMEKAVRKNQADRIVLNLEDSSIQLDAMRAQLNDYPIEGLKEVIVIKDGQVLPFWP